MLTHGSLYYTGHAAHESAHVPGVNRALGTLPLSHAYGILITLAGMHNPEPGVGVLLRWFDPQAFLSLIREHQLQIAAVVPSILQILLTLPLEEHDLSTLQWVSSGGAPLPPEVEAEFCRRVPSVSIRQGYGLTETAALISTNPVGPERSGLRRAAGPGLHGRDRRRRRQRAPARLARRDRRVLSRRHAGLLALTGDDQGGAPRRPPLHRRCRLRRRGRLPVHRRPQEGPHHPRRLQRLPARCRGRARRASGDRGRGRRRPTGSAPRRGGLAFVSLHPGSSVTSEELIAWAGSTSAATSTPGRSTSSTRSPSPRSARSTARCSAPRRATPPSRGSTRARALDGADATRAAVWCLCQRAPP